MTFANTAQLIALGLAGGAILAGPAAPVAAQDKPGDRVNMVIAYSEDECPEAQEGEIVVCEILVEAERYRIPSNLRTSDSPENTSWTRKVDKIRYAGDFGIMSCDPAGAGGELGCTQQMIDAAYADKQQSSRVRFAQLIEEARQERLSTIDLDAAAEQERVEQIEREYLKRLEMERNAPLPGEDAEAGEADAEGTGEASGIEPSPDAPPVMVAPAATPAPTVGPEDGEQPER